jgi:hypothetical protein
MSRRECLFARNSKSTELVTWETNVITPTLEYTMVLKALDKFLIIKKKPTLALTMKGDFVN